MSPDKCTGKVPDPNSIHVKGCEIGIAQQKCGALFRQLRQCNYERIPCIRSDAALQADAGLGPCPEETKAFLKCASSGPADAGR